MESDVRAPHVCMYSTGHEKVQSEAELLDDLHGTAGRATEDNGPTVIPGETAVSTSRKKLAFDDSTSNHIAEANGEKR